jgi:hypothetical protein
MDQELKIKQCCPPTASWLPLNGIQYADFGASILAAEKEYTLTVMSAMPDGMLGSERSG